MRDGTVSRAGSAPDGSRSAADARRYIQRQPARRTRWPGLAAAGLVVLLGTGGPPALAAPAAPATVAAEVEALLQALARSGCRFQRNGRWYGAEEARAHLLVKWREIQKRQLAPTTERFIELGASESMLTGQPYQVQCSPAPAQPSAVWLMQQLRAIRALPERRP